MRAGCVCVGGGLRVNMHHCSRLIFHQTTRSMQRLPPPVDTTVRQGDAGGGMEVQEIGSSSEGGSRTQKSSQRGRESSCFYRRRWVTGVDIRGDGGRKKRESYR